MSSPPSERGGHARPRGLFAPRQRDARVPGQRENSPSGQGRGNRPPGRKVAGPPPEEPGPDGTPGRSTAPHRTVPDGAGPHGTRTTGPNGPGHNGTTPIGQAPDAHPDGQPAAETPAEPTLRDALLTEPPLTEPALSEPALSEPALSESELGENAPVPIADLGTLGTQSPETLAPAQTQAPVPPGTPPGLTPGAPPRSRSARHGAPRSGRSRDPRPGRNKRAKRARLAALAIAAIGVLVIGLAVGGFGSEGSPTQTVEAFLLDWQQQQYTAAGQLTMSSPRTVSATLQGAFTQLYASQILLGMKSVVQHGDTARATFTATIDLTEQSRVWTYQSSFGLRQVNGNWKIEWSPRVVNPSLSSGDRLAVMTKFAARASVLNSEGSPLQLPSPVYVIGVWPDKLTNPAATARAFAQLAQLQSAQVLGQITAAPPQKFFRLATLDPATYAGLRQGLAKIPGLVIERSRQRLYDTEASGLVGEVGSEINPVLRADGSLYLPGTTVGLTGLEQAYQRELLGTPTTEVVVVNSAGAQSAVLARWPGTPGTPVRTTIDSSLQSAALGALSGVSESGEIVAVQADTGQVLAVAQRQGSGELPAAGPLAAQLTPGTSFTIVSAAALLASGLNPATEIPCSNSFTVGGQTFTSDGTGEQKPFSDVFADGCGTAFAGLSERINSAELAQVARELGIGASWSLPVAAFSGSVPSRGASADLAAATIGQGNVRMSLLSMAMVAAAVDNGSWHAPEVVQNASASAGKPVSGLTATTMSALRGLMRDAVAKGAAHAANLSGTAVFGQVGTVHTGSTWTSWFVGYRGDVAVAVIETGKTAQLSAAALAGVFLSAVKS